MTGKEGHHMTDEDKDAIAMERYGKKFEQLDANEKRSVGGLFRQQEAHHEGHGQQQQGKGQGATPAATATTEGEHHHMSQEEKDSIAM